MKKLLLATAAFALIAPAAQAEVKLDLGGYFKGYAGYADQKTKNLRTTDIKRKSEVFFQRETTLDNGMTVGYRGSMLQQAQTDPLSELEESFIYFSGNWGRVNFGRENGAAYLLQVTAPGADANIDGADIDFSFINLAAGNAALQEYSHKGPQENADKITYLTPKFNGFQAGVTYSAELDAKTTDDTLTGLDLDNEAELEGLYEAAARYDGEFSGVGVHAGAGYSTAERENNSTGDFDQWNAGLKFSFENISVGGAYISQDRETNATEIDTWTVGADYNMGAYTFGASYLESDNKEKDQFERYALGSSYTFGPGMKFNGTVGIFDSQVNGASGNDGTFVTLGTDVQF